MLVAALLGAGLLIRPQWAKIKELLGMSSVEEKKENDLEDDFLDEWQSVSGFGSNY